MRVSPAKLEAAGGEETMFYIHSSSTSGAFTSLLLTWRMGWCWKRDTGGVLRRVGARLGLSWPRWRSGLGEQEKGGGLGGSLERPSKGFGLQQRGCEQGADMLCTGFQDLVG